MVHLQFYLLIVWFVLLAFNLVSETCELTLESCNPEMLIEPQTVEPKQIMYIGPARDVFASPTAHNLKVIGRHRAIGRELLGRHHVIPLLCAMNTHVARRSSGSGDCAGRSSSHPVKPKANRALKLATRD